MNVADRCRQSRDQIVYFLATTAEDSTVDEMCYIKVGITSNVADRIRKLQSGCPTPIMLLGVFRTAPWGARGLEKELHKILSEWRVLGEWFRGEPIVFSHIRFILNHPGGEWSPQFQPKTLF